MAGMFYSLEEIAELLGGDEEKAQELVKEHKLREFRDGGTRVVYKASEVDKVLAAEPAAADSEQAPEPEAEVPAEPVEEAPAEEEIFELMEEDSEEPSIELGVEEEEPAIEFADEEPTLELTDEPEEEETVELVDEEPVMELFEDETEPTETEEETPISEEPFSLNVDVPSGDMSTLGLAADETAAIADEKDDDDDGFDLSLEDESLAPLGGVDDDDDLSFLSGDDELDLGNLSNIGGDVSEDSIDALLSSNVPMDDEPEMKAPLDDPKGATAADIISDLTSADTTGALSGVNVLGDGDDDFDMSIDSKAETADVEVDDDEFGDLDDDINLDTVGSGSGLLDLSLQADDTSLGAVLDDILPAAEDEAPMPIGDDMDDLGGDEMPIGGGVPIGAGAPIGAAGGAPSGPTGGAIRYEAEPDASSNLLGILLLLPLLGVIYGIIVVVNGMRGVTPGILESLEDQIWMIMGGLAGLSLILGIIFAIIGGGGEGKPKAKKEKKTKAKAEKKPKAKKEKKPKEPKPKKAKKKK